MKVFSIWDSGAVYSGCGFIVTVIAETREEAVDMALGRMVYDEETKAEFWERNSMEKVLLNLSVRESEIKPGVVNCYDLDD